MWGSAQFFDPLSVLLGRVASVSLPSISGVLLTEFGHEVVAVGFGEDGCCGDGLVFTITLDDALVGDLLIRYESVAIDEQ